MTAINTLQMVLAFLLLLSISLAVKAYPACMKCYKAFACGQKYNECTPPVKDIRLERIEE